MKQLLFSLILITGALQASNKNAAAGNASAPQAPADVKAFADIKAAAAALGGVAVQLPADTGVSDNPNNLMEALKAPYEHDGIGGDVYSIKTQPIEALLKAGHTVEAQHILKAFNTGRWDIVLMLVQANGPLEALDAVAIHYNGGFINNPRVYQGLEELIQVARRKNQLFLATRLRNYLEEIYSAHPELLPN